MKVGGGDPRFEFNRKGKIIGRKRSGLVRPICRKVYEAGGFSARHGEIKAYKNVIAQTGEKEAA